MEADNKEKNKAEEWKRVRKQQADWYNGKNWNMQLGESILNKNIFLKKNKKFVK